jgi:putative tryptophan/tyrosine transport system substrate-binding protein
MRRREFITSVCGAAITWALVARAQQVEPMRRVGVLMTLSEDDPEGRERMEAFLQSLQQLGWSDGTGRHLDC